MTPSTRRLVGRHAVEARLLALLVDAHGVEEVRRLAAAEALARGRQDVDAVFGEDAEPVDAVVVEVAPAGPAPPRVAAERSPQLRNAAVLPRDENCRRPAVVRRGEASSRPHRVGGEGLAFVVHDDPSGTAAEGCAGPGLGYAADNAYYTSCQRRIRNSIAVQLVAFQNVSQPRIGGNWGRNVTDTVEWLDSDTHVPVGDYTKSCDYKDCCWQPKKNSLRCMCHPPKEDGTPVDGSDKYEAYLNTGKCTEIAFTWQVFNTNDNGKPKLDCKALNLIDDRSQWVPGM